MRDAKSIVVAVFNGVAVAVGFLAAFLWWRASKVPIHPTDRRIEFGERKVALGQNISGIHTAYRRSSALNSFAAVATAAALALQAVVTALGSF
jgi:hypothetical protein